MDDRCIRIASDENEKDYIIQYSPLTYNWYKDNENVCVKRIGNDWLVLSDAKEREISYGSLGYFTVPKIYQPMDTASVSATGVDRVWNQPFLNLSGDGVIVGMVDTGIDLRSAAFRDSAGFSRVVSLWDQSDETGSRPDNYYFGSEYNNAQINSLINSDESILPGEDYIGHGTFTMGIAAGSDFNEKYKGIAFRSEIAVVKLRNAKKYLRDFYCKSEDGVYYSECDIMQGVNYLVEYAQRRLKPLVIMIGLGCNYGPHSGLTPLELYLDSVANMVNVVVCVCSGNFANDGLHYSGGVERNQKDYVEFNVGNNAGGVTLELWNKGLERVSVGMISALGEEVPMISSGLRGSFNWQFVFDRSSMIVNYKVIEVISGQEMIWIKLLEPSSGIWRLVVYGGERKSEFDIWMSINANATDTRFITSDPYITLSNPSSAGNVITTGAYNHEDDSYYIKSGRGYAIGGGKPDIVAPGVNVEGLTVGQREVSRSGTSIANAHTAGVASLLLEWGAVKNNAPLMNTFYVKKLMERGARRSKLVNVVPSTEFGYGYLDVYGIFEAIAGIKY